MELHGAQVPFKLHGTYKNKKKNAWKRRYRAVKRHYMSY